MTATSNEALKVALAYFQAMANKDVDGIMTLVHDGIACFNPNGDFEGSERFRAFEDGFARMIEKLTLMKAFGDERQAGYRLRVRHAPGEEFLRRRAPHGRSRQDHIQPRHLRCRSVRGIHGVPAEALIGVRLRPP